MIKFFFGTNLTILEQEINKYLKTKNVQTYNISTTIYEANEEIVFFFTLSYTIN